MAVKMKTLPSFETSVTFYQLKWFNIPKVLKAGGRHLLPLDLERLCPEL